VREHNEAVNFIDVIKFRDEITTEYAPGTLQEVRQHDGSILRLRKLHEGYDPTDRIAAMNHLQESGAKREIATGLLFVDGDPTDLHMAANTVGVPLNLLDDAVLIPGSTALDKVNASLR
jgi:2-oxoglutarate ferredoxin oxidoreductase subunit beta